nr:chymotrypsin-like elastase family member 3B [Oryctolagus cuniculus]
MLRLLSALLLVALASGSALPFYNPSSRVVNGEEAEAHSWPPQALLEYEVSGGWSFTCGGSLIDPDWVLTAGHCISSSRKYRVVLGEHDRTVTEGPEQVISVAATYVHPQWNSSCLSCGNDIALLKLSQSAEVTPEVQPACLPPRDYILPHDTECYVTGWGRLITGGQTANKLQQALLPVVDYAHCSQKDWWGSSVKETMVCAGGGDSSACNGDSGGPLVCRIGKGIWKVYGVVSFGSSRGCNTLQKPTVFTRVSAFIPWIFEVPPPSEIAQLWTL